MLVLVFVGLILINMTQTQFLKLDQLSQINLADQNQFTYIAYVRTSELSGDKDKYLIIQVQSAKKQRYSGLSITVSKVNFAETIQCSGMINLPCVINQRYFGDTDKIKIQIKSDKQGYQMIKAYQGQFQSLKQEQFTYTLDHQIAKYFILPITQQPGPKSIRVSLKPNNQYTYSHITAKTQLTSNKAFQSINMWSGSQQLYLSKLQIGDSKLIYLIVTGQSYEQYTISYEIITKDHYDLEVPEQLNQYLYKNQQRKYHIKFDKIAQKQQLVINFMIYSGNPQIIFYLDASMTKAFKTKYFQYMADSRFVFSAEQLEGVTNLYFKAISNDHNSVFRLQVKRNHIQKAQMLIQNSFNFYSVKADTPKFLYFYLNLDQNQPGYQQPPYINISISLMYVLGSSNLMFFWGDTKNLDCLPECLQDKFQIVKQMTTSAVALKLIYRIARQNKNLQKTSILLIQLWSNNPKKQLQQVSIEYSLDAKIINLRQNYPLTQIVEMSQKKVYRYVQLQDYKTVKICASVISGEVGIIGSQSNPLDSQPGSITPFKNCVEFKNTGRMRTMYVTVFGISKSKYSISVQAGHYSQIVATPLLQTNEDIDYQVTIVPLGSHIFILHPLYSHLRVNYNASHPMKICLLKSTSTNQNNPQLGKQNSQGCDPSFTRQSQVSGQFLDKLNQNSQSKKLEVTNPSLNDKLLFRLKYHSGSYQHCQQKLTNKIYQQDIGSNTCFQFQLQPSSTKQNNYQIITKQMQINPQNLTIALCGKQTLKIRTQRVIQIKQNQIKAKCQNITEPTIQIIAQVDKKLEVAFKIQYIVQAISGIVKIPLDIQFIDYALIAQTGPLRQYIVDPLLQNNIVISLRQYSNQVLFTASIYIADKVSPITQSTYTKLQPILTKTTHQDLQLTIVILEIEIKRQCISISWQKWMQCYIIVVLQPNKRTNIGKLVQYSIQFKTTSKQLKPYQPQTSIITNSQQSDIYTYYPNLQQPTKQKYLTGIQISSQNQPCFELYVNRYNDAQFDKKSTSLVNTTSTFNIFPIDSNVYFIQVLATRANCHYTIQISMINNNYLTSDGRYKVNVLHPNVGFDLRISSGDVLYFVAEGVSGENWRLIYLRKYGNIRMFAVEYNATTQQAILKNQSYQFSQKHYSIYQQFDNNIRLLGKQQGMYIIAIKTQFECQGTLILHNDQLPLTIPNSKTLMYSLDIFQSVYIKFYTPNSKLKTGKLNIDLLFGQINVNTSLISNAQGQKQQRQILSQCCADGHNVIPFAMPESANVSMQYLTVKIDHKPPWKDVSVFEVSVQLDNPEVLASDIDKDVLNHLQIGKEYKTVVKTTSIYADYKLIISADKNTNKTFRQDTDNDKDNNNKQSITKYNSSQSQNKTQQQQQISNILDCLQVEINPMNTHPFLITKKYTLLNNVLYVQLNRKMQTLQLINVDLLLDLSVKDQCPIDNVNISVTPDLGDKLSLLAPFKWAYLSKERNFAIASKQEFLIDIVSCSGAVNLSIAKTYSQLYNQTQNYQKTSMLSHQPHVFKIIPIQTITYFKLKNQQAIIRYIKPNMQRQIGIGYYKYKWDYFQYETDYQKLTIILKPIQNITATNTIIMDVIYFIKIISDLDTRHSSVQCMDVGAKTVFFDLVTTFDNEQQKLYISKQALLQELDGKPDNLYISVDAAVEILSGGGEIQTYKFLAPTQEIPLDVFNMTRLSNKIIGFGIFIIIVVIFGCGALAQLFLTYVVPILGRFRGTNQLVQQQNPPGSQQLQNIPVSSDRNQRVTNLQQQKVQSVQIPPSTQQKMQT